MYKVLRSVRRKLLKTVHYNFLFFLSSLQMVFDLSQTLTSIIDMNHSTSCQKKHRKQATVLGTARCTDVFFIFWKQCCNTKPQTVVLNFSLEHHLSQQCFTALLVERLPGCACVYIKHKNIWSLGRSQWPSWLISCGEDLFPKSELTNFASGYMTIHCYSDLADGHHFTQTSNMATLMGHNMELSP